MPRKVIAVVDDLFFASKIQATAEPLGVELKFVRSLNLLTDTFESDRPDLIVVDLHNQRVDAMLVAKTIKKNPEGAAIPLLAFFSHVETEMQQAALAAGYDRVIPRSVFSRDLAGILQGSLGFGGL
jgi:CheY-like chemotaxis protein